MFYGRPSTASRESSSRPATNPSRERASASNPPRSSNTTARSSNVAGPGVPGSSSDDFPHEEEEVAQVLDEEEQPEHVVGHPHRVKGAPMPGGSPLAAKRKRGKIGGMGGGAGVMIGAGGSRGSGMDAFSALEGARNALIEASERESQRGGGWFGPSPSARQSRVSGVVGGGGEGGHTPQAQGGHGTPAGTRQHSHHDGPTPSPAGLKKRRSSQVRLVSADSTREASIASTGRMSRSSVRPHLKGNIKSGVAGRLSKEDGEAGYHIVGKRLSAEEQRQFENKIYNKPAKPKHLMETLAEGSRDEEHEAEDEESTGDEKGKSGVRRRNVSGKKDEDGNDLGDDADVGEDEEIDGEDLDTAEEDEDSSDDDPIVELADEQELHIEKVDACMPQDLTLSSVIFTELLITLPRICSKRRATKESSRASVVYAKEHKCQRISRLVGVWAFLLFFACSTGQFYMLTRFEFKANNRAAYNIKQLLLKSGLLRALKDHGTDVYAAFHDMLPENAEDSNTADDYKAQICDLPLFNPIMLQICIFYWGMQQAFLMKKVLWKLRWLFVMTPSTTQALGHAGVVHSPNGNGELVVVGVRRTFKFMMAFILIVRAFIVFTQLMVGAEYLFVSPSCADIVQNMLQLFVIYEIDFMLWECCIPPQQKGLVQSLHLFVPLQERKRNEVSAARFWWSPFIFLTWVVLSWVFIQAGVHELLGHAGTEKIEKWWQLADVCSDWEWSRPYFHLSYWDLWRVA